ncbi:cellulose-binding domain-containing protein [Mangrovihabitans endophyticus]|uniref:Hydrolase n=1 Tax=Mangrovihabitans endophyticus TaxID=1751298 RepID=A0A8J3FPV1_9ACTN|nr:cellulose-binding domain-containing protein [Mangrovihabitans endophyticus]GGL04215.1 hydrolase [Mangrovihabitans endophyticus]
MRFAPLAVAGVALVAAAGFAVTPAQAATACDVAWTANQWNAGFTADVRLTNNAAPIASWTLTWTFGGSQQITSAWNATVSQSGPAVSASSLAWNGTLATGASATFGFQATGTNATPSDFAVNGVSCAGDGGTPPTSPTPTSPTPTSPTPSSPSPSPSQPPGCGSGAACDGFETQAGGTPSGDWSVTYPDCQGTGTAAIDRTTAHSGAASLRVNGAAGYCNHVFVRSTRMLATTTDTWYVRYWVRHTTALPAAHTTAVALRDAADGDRDLRFGGQNGALQWNRASDDATLPEQSPAGVAQSAPLPVGTWNCVEFKVDGTDGTMQTWLNGESVPGLLEDGVPTHDIDGQWLNRTYRPRLTDLRLGWESYGDGADTLWYDDVVVSAARNHC